MKKVLITILSLILILSVLTGCGGNYGFVASINDDFTGDLNITFGYSEKVINDSLEKGNLTEADVASLTKYEANGKSYYGEITKGSYIGAAEFNIFAISASAACIDITSGIIGKELDAGALVALCGDNGELLITFATNENTISTKNVTNAFAAESKNNAKEFIENSTFIYELTLPCEVKQTSGSSKGVTLKDNILTIDVIKLTEENQTSSLLFTSEPGMVTDPPIVSFDDVKENKWYYNAVMAMARKGVVAGVGEGKFNPDGTLTYAEFSQVLAGFFGLETGSENGYWAYKAIESCVSKGYIEDLGEIKNANYGVTIPREAAVSAMVMASTKTPTGTFTDKDIPDFASISDKYKENIVKAYNLGITTGVDANHTFNPKKSLTRAEICQLFMTMD